MALEFWLIHAGLHHTSGHITHTKSPSGARHSADYRTTGTADKHQIKQTYSGRKDIISTMPNWVS